jgi:predicted lipid-binding transport protein (Tim44 family)
MAPAARLAALVLLPALALGACGQTSKDSAGNFQGEQKAVATAIEDLQNAGRKGDAVKICSQLLAPALVDQINRASKRPCDKVLKDDLADVDAYELQVQKVTVTGDRADAVVESQAGSKKRTDTLQLQKVGGAWKIAKLAPAR